MQPPKLPKIGPIKSSRVPRISESTNPGTVDPSRQQFKRPAINGTVTSSISSGSVNNSNGENQVPKPDINGTVTVTAGSVPLRNVKIEDNQRKNRRPSDSGVTSSYVGRGLPVESFPASGQIEDHVKPTWTPYAPPATDVDAGRRKMGGLAENVIIK